MEALEIYKKNAKPADWAIKNIEGGRLKGMSDINPQWRILALTETFGLCGIGWKFEVVKEWIERANDEASAFVNVNLFIKVDDKWSDAIPGTGGASFVAKETKGLYQSDECFKMATTDALSVCCKYIGIASDIYSGSKYSAFTKKAEQTEQEKQTQIDIDNFVREAATVENREGYIKLYNQFKHLTGQKVFNEKCTEINNKYPKTDKK